MPPTEKNDSRNCAIDHERTIGEKSFKDTYRASVRAFLIDAKRNWQDHGFPTTLGTDGIIYLGKHKAGERKQRAFTLNELKRLFEGPDPSSFQSSRLGACGGRN